MKKRAIELVMAAIMLFIIYFIAIHNGFVSVIGKVNKDLVIVLDAGHGGKDPGKVGKNNVLEKDINLQIVLKLNDLLKKDKINVILTRDDDYGLYSESDSNKKSVDMKKRCAIINDSKASLAISIHQNSYQSEGVKGAQVFYYSKSEEAKVLAGIVQKNLITNVDNNNGRKEKSNDSYYMLLNTSCPTVIVECGFLSNNAELALLADDEYQEKIAFAIYTGIIEYLDKK